MSAVRRSRLTVLALPDANDPPRQRREDQHNEACREQRATIIVRTVRDEQQLDDGGLVSAR